MSCEETMIDPTSTLPDIPQMQLACSLHYTRYTGSTLSTENIRVL